MCVRSVLLLLLICGLGKADLPPIPENITVGAYYYPWYGKDFHHHGGYLRKFLDPRQWPQLGEYDDSNPATIAQHLAWSRQANINLWATSWWGPGSQEDNTTRNVILPHPDLGSHKIAILYESTGPNGRVRPSEGYTTQRVAGDMSYICQTYFNHPNYLRIDGRPVVIIYLSRLMDMVGALQSMTQLMRSAAQQTCGQNVFLVGDQVWGEAPAYNVAYPPFSMLDAVTNYDVYGNMNHPPYAGQAAVDNYYRQQQDWRQRAWTSGVRYIPAVSPGYNDRGVRFADNHVGLSRRLNSTSDEGSLLTAQLQQARYLTDPGAGNILLVNSFNEWHEDTQVEPCIGVTTTNPVNLTGNLPYEGYGELFLDILRTETLNESLLSTASIPSSQSAPSNLLVGAYYYPWYGKQFFSRGYLRSQLTPPQVPALGSYSGGNSSIIAQHLLWSQQANIGLWVASWWGPTHISDYTIRNFIFPHPNLGSHQIALLYEASGRMSASNNWDTSNVVSDLEYICETYFGESNYFRVKGRPVVFVTWTIVLKSAGVLDNVIGLMRSVAANYGYEIYLVGDQVWKDAPTGNSSNPFYLFDAVTNIDVYGNMASTLYAGEATVDFFYKTQLNGWKNEAMSNNCGFIPGVTPGFNDRGFNLAANHSAFSRQLTAGSEEGSLFNASLARARYLVDPGVNNLLMVNSFNQWREDTQIEPLFGTTAAFPWIDTQGLTYRGYGELYLNLLSSATTG